MGIVPPCGDVGERHGRLNAKGEKVSSALVRGLRAIEVLLQERNSPAEEVPGARPRVDPEEAIGGM